MAQFQVHFAVHIMPPKRPASSLTPNRKMLSDEPLRTLAVGARVNEKFQDVWGRIEKQYEAGYTPEERAAMYFSRMQTSMKADITLSDRVGMLYNERTPRDERVLFIQTVAIDRDGSIADTSGLRPTGFKRPRIEDLSPDLQDSIKRRKLQELRYGATVDELDPNVPLVSRESQGLDRPEDGDAEELAEQRRDEDGFAIPKKINRRPRKHNAQPEQQSQGTVLVGDSQVQHEADRHLSNLEVLQQGSHQRPGSRPRSAHSLPLENSSPGEAAAARANTTVPQAGAMRSARQTHQTTSTARRNSTDSHGKPKTLPTPESHDRRRSSNEAPTLAPRSASSRASISDRSRCFVRRPVALASEQGLAIAEQDPIEDGDAPLLNGIDDELLNGIEDDVLPEAPGHEAASFRGRERSRSIDSAEQDRRSRSTRDTADCAPDTASTSAFDMLTSSQATQVVRNRSGSAKKTWSIREDKLLLRGIRLHYNAGKIVQLFKINRSESSARNRRLMLLKKYPNGNVPRDDPLYEEAGELSDESEEESESGGTADPPTKRRKWLQSDVGRLRKAIADGYDVFEIRAGPFFSARSEEAIIRKIRELEISVLKAEKLKDSWPKDAIAAPGWSDRHSLRLRRMFRDDVDEEDACERWFRSVSKQAFKKKVREYRRQMKSVDETRLADLDAANAQLFESQVDEPSQDISEAPTVHEQRVVENVEQSASFHTDGLVTPPSMNSSPPSTTRIARPPSPSVFITGSEQRKARQKQSTKGKSKGDSKQKTLNFPRGKGKGALGQRASIAEIDRNFRRTTTTSRNTAQPAQQDPPEVRETIFVSSGEEESNVVEANEEALDKVSKGENDLQKLEHPENPQFDDDDSIQPGTTPRQTLSHSHNGGEQASARSDHKDEQPIPARDLRRRLTKRDPRLTKYPSRSVRVLLHADGRSLPSASRGTHVDSNPVVHDSVESRLDRQLIQELQQSVSSADTVRLNAQKPEPPVVSRELSEVDDSHAFQTQDPRSTLSQREKGLRNNGVTERPQSQHSLSFSDQDSQESPVPDNQGISEEDSHPQRGSAVARPCPYNIGAKPLRPNSSIVSQRLTRTGASLQAHGPTIIARAEPGKLPRTSSKASHLLQQRKKLRAQASAESTTSLQSTPKPEPTVTLRYEHRPVGPDGKIEVGRPGFTTRVAPNDKWVMSDERLYAEAARSVGRPEFTQDMFERNKLRNEQWIAMICHDEEEILRLKAKDRRLRRDRRKRYGLPPLPRKRNLVAGSAFEEDARAVEYHVEYLNETDSDTDDELDDVVMRLDPKKVKDPSILQDSKKFLEFVQGQEGETDEEEAVEQSYPKAIDFDRHVTEVDDTDDVDVPNDINDAEVRGPVNGTQLSIRKTQAEERGDDDDFSLPTAPPQELVVDNNINAPSNGELQDLVQSGDVEMYDDDRHLIGTRLDTAKRDSPAVLLTAHGSTHSTDDSTSISSLDGADDCGLNDSSVQSLGRNAMLRRNTQSANRVVPPWPSSGKVRSSVESSTSPVKAATSDVQVPGTSQTSVQQSQNVLLAQNDHSEPKKKEKNHKKRPRDTSEAVPSGVTTQQQSNERKAKTRKQDKKDRPQLNESEDARSNIAAGRQTEEPAAQGKKKKRNKSHGYEITARKEDSSKPQPPNDRETMPPPPQIPKSRRPRQQQQQEEEKERQTSFSSEASLSSSISANGMNGSKRSKRRARIAAKRDSASEHDGSIDGTATSDSVIGPNAQPLLRQMEVAGSRPMPEKTGPPITLSNLHAHKKPTSNNVPAIKLPTSRPSINATAPQAAAGALKPNGRVTPIGETQSTGGSKAAKQITAKPPAQTQSTNGGSSFLWKVWETVTPHIPRAPAYSDQRVAKPVKLPYSDDEEDDDDGEEEEEEEDGGSSGSSSSDSD